jgi:hypothetical protein
VNVSQNTVRAAVRSDGAPRYERPAKGSVADAFEPRIQALLRAYPTMPASVIGERIRWRTRTVAGNPGARQGWWEARAPVHPRWGDGGAGPEEMS